MAMIMKKRNKTKSLVSTIAILLFGFCNNVTAYSTTSTETATTTSRRRWIRSLATAFISESVVFPAVANAISNKSSPLPKLMEAQDTLDKLLTNWKKATIDCTYADVPRELLEAKNKELLLEKASTFALFDKSVSVETCKTTNRIVRDYLGVTGKGPLVGIEKSVRTGLEFLDDPDDVERYFDEIEAFSQALSRATSLSYAAGVADFDGKRFPFLSFLLFFLCDTIPHRNF